ncbi:protein of unknown function [Maridesulfovibrio hydrothermalis AM13 = DSM 14728]|uniref:Uncharacterized protein n=1 Tax=Maridesulfovibrio hydrothermalis AM13 = DSM 14728 TaxID=1121451 RepID=L0RAL7_9BACT|nr:protein of unknown function [Maridesulfovibrio hydrothermalis AM13 = DSM 14728]
MIRTIVTITVNVLPVKSDSFV